MLGLVCGSEFGLTELWMAEGDLVEDDFALSWKRMKLGIAMAAKIPMIPTTIRSSRRVKPFLVLIDMMMSFLLDPILRGPSFLNAKCFQGRNLELCCSTVRSVLSTNDTTSGFSFQSFSPKLSGPDLFPKSMRTIPRAMMKRMMMKFRMVVSRARAVFARDINLDNGSPSVLEV